MLSRLYVISPLSGLPQSVTGTTVGLSAAIAAASAVPHCSRSVPLVYQIFPASNEESLNNQKTFMQNRKRRLKMHRLFLSLCRIQIADQNQQREHQGKNTDGPGIHCLTGTKHQQQAGHCQSQRTHNRCVPGNHPGKFTAGLQVDAHLLRQMFPVPP